MSTSFPSTAEALAQVIADYRKAVATDRLFPSGTDRVHGEVFRLLSPGAASILSLWGTDAGKMGRLAKGMAYLDELREKVHEHQALHGISSLVEERFTFPPLGWSTTTLRHIGDLAMVGDDRLRRQQAGRDLAAAFLDLAMGAAAEAGWVRLRELDRDEPCEDSVMRQFVYYEEWMPADLRKEIPHITSAFAEPGADGGANYLKAQALSLHLDMGRRPGDDCLMDEDGCRTATFLLVHSDAMKELKALEGIA